MTEAKGDRREAMSRRPGSDDRREGMNKGRARGYVSMKIADDRPIDESSVIRSHRDLLIWQRAMNLVEYVFRMVENLPRDARELVWQLHRAAISVPSNIAEGRGRRGSREFSRFLSIARGSLMELDTLVEIGRRLRFFESASAFSVEAEIVELSRMIGTLQRRLTPMGKSKP